MCKFFEIFIFWDCFSRFTEFHIGVCLFVQEL